MDLEPAEALRVLASVDRQYLLYELLEQNGRSTVGELSQRIAVRRHRTRPERLSETEIDRARVRLVHIHIPLLLDRNVIDVDWSDGTVTLADDHAVDDLLETAEELDDWPPKRRIVQ